MSTFSNSNERLIFIEQAFDESTAEVDVYTCPANTIASISYFDAGRAEGGSFANTTPAETFIRTLRVAGPSGTFSETTANLGQGIVANIGIENRPLSSDADNFEQTSGSFTLSQGTRNQFFYPGERIFLPPTLTSAISGSVLPRPITTVILVITERF